MIVQHQHPFGKGGSPSDYILPLLIVFGTVVVVYAVKAHTDKLKEEEENKSKFI